MQLQWYGHSCFLLTAENGTRILTDPCAPKTGYDLHDIACDIITSSHGHYDHNYFEAAAGEPLRLTEAGVYEADGMRITALSSFHDEVEGAKRGTNLIFVYEIDGLRIVHAGDLGHLLSEQTLAAIGRVDLLLCPVGGVFTVDAEGAAALMRALAPRVFVPMHYKTPHLSFELSAVEDFLSLAPERKVQKLNNSVYTVTADTLPAAPATVVFDYALC